MLSTARPTLWRALVVVLTIMAALAVAGCGAAGTAGPGASAGPAASAAAGPVVDPGGGEEQPTGQDPDVANPRPAPNNLLIIKTGNLTLQVSGIDDALTAATQKVDALGGYVSASQRSGDEESDYASVTFRIPAASWDQALVALRGLAQKVVNEQSSSDDVTGAVVDLAARIRNLQATETALQAVMTKATAIKDILTVQAELTTVRGQIEELAGQKAHLEQQAAFSTLTVAFTLKPTPVITVQQQFDPGTEVDRASASLVSMLQGLATAGIWFAIVWIPILAFLAIVGGIAFVVFRRLQRRSGSNAPPSPSMPAAPTSA